MKEIFNTHYEIYMISHNNRESALMTGAYLQGTINTLACLGEISFAQKEEQAQKIIELTAEMINKASFLSDDTNELP